MLCLKVSYDYASTKFYHQLPLSNCHQLYETNEKLSCVSVALDCFEQFFYNIILLSSLDQTSWSAHRLYIFYGNQV